MNEYTPELYELIDENGNIKRFELISTAEIGGETYFAMMPAIEGDDYLNMDTEIQFLKSVYEDGEEILASIEDTDEYVRVSEYFLRVLEDYFDGDDDEM